MPDHAPASRPTPADDDDVDRGPLASAHLLRTLGVTMGLGGLVTAITIIVPHEYTRHDGVGAVLAAALVVLGVGLERWSRRSPGRAVVQLGCLAASVVLLVLTWTTLPDLGGIDAIFLVLPLVVSASIGPLRWTLALLAVQVAGYAVVLHEGDSLAGFDKVTQWEVILVGLVVTMLYQGMVRRELRRVHGLLRRRASELESANASLREADDLQRRFIANAAHELRTPLTSVYGFSSTLQDRWSQLDERTRIELVQAIVDQSARMGRLVDDLLTLSRIEAGAVPSRPEPTPVAGAIDAALSMLEEDDIEVRGDTDVAAHADPHHLQQLLLNFLTNAIKYGAAPIVVAVDAEPETVVIRVCDCGAGVPEEFADKLFTRFARASSAVASQGGTGLGLSIAQGLAEIEHGEVWHEPNVPRGARFCMRLPRAKPAD